MLIESSCYITFDGNGNVFPICDRFRDIRSRNGHDLGLDLDLENGAKGKCKYANRKVLCNFLCWQLHCLPYLPPITRRSRMSFPMYSIRISDLEN